MSAGAPRPDPGQRTLANLATVGGPFYQAPARCPMAAHRLRRVVKIGALTATLPGCSSVNAHTSASNRSGESAAPGSQVHS